MLSIIKKRLGARILIYTMLGVSAFGLLMGFYVHRNSNLRLESEKALYLKYGNTQIINIISNINIFFAILSVNTLSLSDESEKILEDPAISYVAFYKTGTDGGESELLFEKYSNNLAPEKFKFPEPDWTGLEGDVSTLEIQSDDGAAFWDFCALVVDIQTSAEGPGKPVGWVRIGISLETLHRQIHRQRIGGFGLIGAVLIMGLAIVLGSLRAVMPPVNRLAQAAKQFGEGKHDVEVKVTSEDEIGLLTKTFNEMVANISRESERSKNLIENIADAIMLLTEVTEKLRAISTDQATGTAEQSSIVQEVVSTTGEIAATASNIAGAADSVNQTAEKASGVCNKGKDYITGAISGMNQINAQVEKVSRQIKELSGQVQQIGGVIEIIEEISGQTNLLALNAALEAAGAGKAGRRFSVVATEVRRLATRTLEFTESVQGVIDNIQQATSAMVLTSEEQQNLVAEGARAVQQMGEYFEHILEMVDSTSRSAAEISLITKQQATASGQMVTSISGVEEVAKQVEKGNKEMENLVIELKTLADHLQSQIEEKDLGE